MKYPRPPFDIVAEVVKMRKLTNLPITDIVFLNPAQEFEMTEANNHRAKEPAELYINGTAIGNMEYYIFPETIGCDTSAQDRLNWNKIYELCEHEILPIIQAAEPLTHAVRPLKYKRLAVHDADGTLIKLAFCNYINGEWSVVVTGLNVVERKVEVSVTLTLPPKPNK